MEITQKKPMTQIIASNGAKFLQNEYHLSNKQIMKAHQMALTLATNSDFKEVDNYNKLKYCYDYVIHDYPNERCMYPVKYGNSIQAMISAEGFKQDALKSGEYEDIRATEVYSCDHLKRNRVTGEITVEFEEDYNKMKDAEIIGYYAYAIKKGTNDVICNSLYWTKEECQYHGKTYSKTYNSVWGKDSHRFNEMAEKTVVKLLCKKLKMTPMLEKAIQQDQYVYGQGYADNPENKKIKPRENDITLEEAEIKGVDIVESTGEVIEIESEPIVEETPEMIATADLREQLENKNH